MAKQSASANSFLVKDDMKWINIGTLFVTVLVTLASLAGLVFTNVLYPTKELVLSFYVNDILTLVIGVPILLGSMRIANWGKLAGLLLWPGAFFFMIYNYFIYAISMPINAAYFVYPIIVILSILLLVRLISEFNSIAIQKYLRGKVAEIFGGSVLMLLGFVFVGRAISQLVANTDILITEIALNLSDVILSISWIIVGLWLLRKNEMGYALGLGMLFQGSMLFIGLIALMILQPILIGAQIAFEEILLVIAMGFIVFIPFTLFLRGVLKKKELGSE